MSVMSVSSDPPVSARRAQTRSRLMTAAATVFAEKGVAGASVEELCEAAGFTRGAFYSNFESKDELCFALQRSLADSAMEALREALTRIKAVPATVDELIDIAVDTFLAGQAQNPTEAMLVKELELYALRHPDFGRTFVELQQNSVTLFGELIEDALETHDRTLALPSTQIIEILHAVQRAAQTSELLQPDAPSPVATQLKTLVAALVR
ncbi:TetR/AcrR family transcriptional regulator [Ammonicoccus fulvus]|uniref:TetR/AcrR family transcriptional regulator n=1 Tax=Ammonicoccus fulvus TaxID=3138240 RepID=A0ABZ3FSZ5_9ACTN